MKNNKYGKSSLWDQLFIFKKNIEENIRKEGLLNLHDLTFSQVGVLRFIGPLGKETMKNIANYLKITPPSATEIVAELEKKGLVKRKKNKKDRRIVLIVLTPTAKKVFSSLCKQRELILEKILSKLNKKDSENLGRIIKILIKD
jgi:DNA-binding MarR family transcriptional regulator